MDRVVAMGLTNWQGICMRDPRRLIRGSAQWGMPYGIANQSGPPNANELEAMLVRVRDAGVRSMDTARAYGDAEQRIGEILREVPSNEGWPVLTKLAPDVH